MDDVTSALSPTYDCGDYTYTVTKQDNSAIDVLSVSSTGVLTMNVPVDKAEYADSETYSVQVVIGFADSDYSATITEKFTITVTPCVVTGINAETTLANTEKTF